jgi:large subunit ribosomal protein L25
MNSVSISGSLRENVGKKDAKRLRKEGKIPCVIYGGTEQVHFWTDVKSFKDLIFTPKVNLVTIELGTKVVQASLQDVQYHPVSDNILHVDFLEIVPSKPIIIFIPIRITGTSPGLLRGGKLVHKVRKLKVRAIPEHLPDQIDVPIDNLDIEDSFKVGDLKLENVTFLDKPTNIIVSVRTTRGVEEPVPGAPPAK